MKYLHYAKSAYSEEQIKAKMNIEETDGVEIQLLNVVADKFWEDDWLYSISDESRNSIRTIHMPLTTRVYKGEELQDDYGLESKQGSVYLQKLVDRVRILEQKTGHRIGVVVHLELADYILKRSFVWFNENEEYKNAWELHVSKMRDMASAYSDIDFYIENATLYDAPLTSIKFVKEINMANVKACVDICHLMMCQHTARAVKDIGHPYYSLTNYFELAKDKIGLIHFCGAEDLGEGYGYGKGHGVVTRPADTMVIYSILNQFNINVPLVLEVKEEDYIKCTNYRRQLEICLQEESRKAIPTI